MNQLFYTILFILFISISAYAGIPSVPQLINYQGYITNAEGKGITGTHKIEFRLYDSITKGNILWGPQTFNSVSIVQGQFFVILGPLDKEKRSIVDALDNDECFLGMKVGETNSNLKDIVEITPRQKILSVPYAIKAETSQTIKGDNLFENQEKGFLGIGTTQPQTKLHVNGEIIISQTGTDCNSSTEGAIRYDSNNIAIEFCNGNEWVKIKKDCYKINFYSCNDILEQKCDKGNGASFI